MDALHNDVPMAVQAMKAGAAVQKGQHSNAHVSGIQSLVVFLLVVVTSSDVFAQSGQSVTGALTATVTDSTGGVLVGATCQVDGRGAARTAVVDNEGRCQFDSLSVGTYRLTIELPGFAPRVVPFHVGGERIAVLRVTLSPAALDESVVVSATRLPTPVSALPNTVTIVDQSVIEQRTASSDDLASVLEANVPGFGPSLKKLNGGGESLRGRNPLYTINGVPQNTPLRDGQRDGHTIDLDFVERIEVIHGSNAIQGIGATGGVVNMVTKSPRSDGAWSHDVKVSLANSDGFEGDGWTSKLSYLLGKRMGRVEWVAGAAIHKRGLFYDASGRAIGLYPTQGDIMDSTARDFYGKLAVNATPTRRIEVAVNDFRLARDGGFVSVPGKRTTGLVSTTVPGDPRPSVGEPAFNDTTTLSVDYRDRHALGGELVLQAYAQDYEALFEGGLQDRFALTTGGPPFLDQSTITSDKFGAKATWSIPNGGLYGFTPMLGLDVSTDTSAQRLARTGRSWVPESTLFEIAPLVQLQRAITRYVLLSGGVRVGIAQLRVDDFTTLPSVNRTFVAGGRPRFTELLPNIGAVFYPGRNVSLFASFSEGFTMPDVGLVLRALDTPGLDVDSLVDVEPVVTGNIEVGADYRIRGVSLHASYYRSNADRGSVLERTADGLVFAVRRERTEIDGVDLRATIPVTLRWSVGGTVSWLRGRFDSNDDERVDTDMDGLNVAPGRVNLFVQGESASGFTARLQVSTLLDRTVEGLAPPRFGREFRGYTLADLALGFPTKHGTFRLGIENLLDKQYVLHFSQAHPVGANDTFFAGQGRSFALTFERRF